MIQAVNAVVHENLEPAKALKFYESLKAAKSKGKGHA